MEFRKGHTIYHCWATGNGGIPYHDHVTAFPSDMSEQDVVDELEAMYAPYSGGHRGFKVEKVPTASEVLHSAFRRPWLENAAEQKAAARRVMDGINNALAEASLALRLSSDNVWGMGEHRDPNVSGAISEGIEELERARDLLAANPAYEPREE